MSEMTQTVPQHLTPDHVRDQKEQRAPRTRTPNPDPAFEWKCAMLLLGQNKWVQRRVENVSFTEHGTTRRQLSFDFLLPEDKRLIWQSSGAQEPLIAVPLTFLGKGDLIHADACSADGNPVPILRLQENADISISALNYCFRELIDAAQLEQDIIKSSENESSEQGNHQKSFDLETFHSSIVFSSVDDTWLNMDRKQTIASLLDMLSTITTGLDKQQPDLQEKFSKEHIEPSFSSNDEKTDFDDSPYQQNKKQYDKYFFLNIENYIYKKIKESRDLYSQSCQPAKMPIWAVNLITYLLLLSTSCDNYICTVLVPEASLYNRSILKLSFDSSYQETSWDRYMHPSSERINMSFQMSSAQSTHVEINPIPGSRIALVEWNLNHDRQFKMRSSVAAGRVHISTMYKRFLPLAHLRMTLLNKLPTILANCAWSAMFLTCSLINFLFANGHFPISKQYFEPSNILAILALFLTLWVARRINAIEHSVSEDLSRYPSLLISTNLAFTSISYFLCGLLQQHPNNVLPLLITVCTIASLISSLPVFNALIVWIWYRIGKRIFYSTDRKVDNAESLDYGIERFWTEGHRVTFLVDNGTVPLPQFNGDYEHLALEQAKRLISGQEKRSPNTKHDIMAALRNMRIRNLHERIVTRLNHIVFPNDYLQSSPSLYPADHGPYSILERKSYKKEAMEDKQSFVDNHWHLI